MIGVTGRIYGVKNILNVVEHEGFGAHPNNKRMGKNLIGFFKLLNKGNGE